MIDGAPATDLPRAHTHDLFCLNRRVNNATQWSPHINMHDASSPTNKKDSLATRPDSSPPASIIEQYYSTATNGLSASFCALLLLIMIMMYVQQHQPP
jgi:hypothetical protein